MDLGCQRALFNHFLWMGIVICKLMWLIKIASFLNAQIAAMNRRKRFHWTRYELNGDWLIDWFWNASDNVYETILVG